MSNTSERNLVVVGGERFWHDLFPTWRVTYCRLQTTRWVLREDRLFIADDTPFLMAWINDRFVVSRQLNLPFIS
jgi:hypothetical protein